MGRSGQNGTECPASCFGAIFKLLGKLFDLLRLLVNGDRKDFGSVIPIDLEFKVAHFGEKPVYRFAEYLFLCQQLPALCASRSAPRILSVLLLGGLRRIDRHPTPRCRYRLLRLKEQKAAEDYGEISEEAAAGIRHIHLRGRAFRAALRCAA